MARVIKVTPKAGNIQPLDICHLILDEIPGSMKMSFTGTRFIDETHSGQQKFKIRIPGGYDEIKLSKIIGNHLTACKVTVKNFKHLCGECQFEGRRFYVSLTLTQAATFIVDGSVTPL